MLQVGVHLCGELTLQSVELGLSFAHALSLEFLRRKSGENLSKNISRNPQSLLPGRENRTGAFARSCALVGVSERKKQRSLSENISRDLQSLLPGREILLWMLRLQFQVTTVATTASYPDVLEVRLDILQLWLLV